MDKLEVKGITIHNTGSTDSAKELQAKLSKNKENWMCHYIVDENEVIQVTPDTEMAYHTGKGYDFGNRFTLAIEICRSQSDWELYKQAQDRAITLVKELQTKYSLTNRDIYFHRDFNTQTYCPHRILDEYGNKENFIGKELG